MGNGKWEMGNGKEVRGRARGVWEGVDRAIGLRASHFLVEVLLRGRRELPILRDGCHILSESSQSPNDTQAILAQSMPYVLDTASSLAEVLNHAARLSQHRVAGYAANADFWLAEVRHCFEVLDGYDARFVRMREATDAYVSLHPLDSQRSDASDTSTTKSIKDHEIRAARRSVSDAACAFFGRCAELGLLAPELSAPIDELLGLPLYGDAPPTSQ
jgi:ElaB/YqjD/DUF883 family membrane-anchored ribosome-binding protein